MAPLAGKKRFLREMVDRRFNSVVDSAQGVLDDAAEQGITKNLHYHDFTHTEYVLHACWVMAEAEDLPWDQRMLLIMAAACHDVGYVLRYENNEPVGADFARQAMELALFSQGDIRIVENLIIRGTMVTFNEAAGAIEQKPVTKLEKMLADADFYHLGDNFKDFELKSELFKRELNKRGNTISESQWRSIQIALLKHHRFFIQDEEFSSGLRKLGAKRQRQQGENLRLLQQQLEDLRTSARA